jgi:hypothetical protein
MELSKLLSLIPSKSLEELAIETEVDVFSKKLQGEVVFKLILHCLISQKDNSLRGMESAYETLIFRMINRKHDQNSVRYSSISKRLSTINPEYFAGIFKLCTTLYNQQLGKDTENVIRFDSTIVSLSSRLLNIGYHIGGSSAENVRQLKFTVGYSNGIAEEVRFFHTQSYTSENIALKESILLQSAEDKTRVKVFDRGITSRETYDTFSDNEIQFISRLNDGAKYKIVNPNKGTNRLPVQTESLVIVSDDWCKLYGNKGKESKHLYRRIVATRLQDAASLTFITNNTEMSAEEITTLYKRRWDIEVFFKFIKQLLNFNHLVSRNENGIKVILYVTLIAAVLLAAFKRSNNLTGYKIPKQKFANELEIEIVKLIITFSGGDPEKLNEILLRNTS